MKKESAGVIILVLLTITLLASFVSAQSFNTNVEGWFAGFRDNLVDPIKSFTDNTVVFVRFLFFILVFLIINAILTYVPLFDEKKGTAILVAFVVTILAVFFIPIDLILPMLNPYTALGVALISIIPFALLVIFTEKMLRNAFVRQVVWMFFSLTLIGMTVYTTVLQYNGTPGTPGMQGSVWFSIVYGFMSILALCMLYFNTKIRRLLFAGKLESGYERAQSRIARRKAARQIEDQEDEVTLGTS